MQPAAATLEDTTLIDRVSISQSQLASEHSDRERAPSGILINESHACIDVFALFVPELRS
jgi:hypothetical protein